MTTSPQPPPQPGVLVTLDQIWEIVRKLEHLPEKLDSINERLDAGMASQEQLIADVREELRAEVRNRDQKIANVSAEVRAHDSRLTSLEADKHAREVAEGAADRQHSRRTPWTAIVALALAALGWLSTFVKDLIN